MTMDEQAIHPTLCPPTGNMYIHALLLIDSLLVLLSDAAGLTPQAMLVPIRQHGTIRSICTYSQKLKSDFGGGHPPKHSSAQGVHI